MQGFHGCDDACMETQSKPQGRPMSEIRRLVREDETRFADLAKTWPELLVSEQVELVLIAHSMRRGTWRQA